jgi:hypothetical protein
LQKCCSSWRQRNEDGAWWKKFFTGGMAGHGKLYWRGIVNAATVFLASRNQSGACFLHALEYKVQRNFHLGGIVHAL